LSVLDLRLAEEASALFASVAAGEEMKFASIVRPHHQELRLVSVVVAGDEEIAEEAVAPAAEIRKGCGPGLSRSWR